jgi:hypothetical protein
VARENEERVSPTVRWLFRGLWKLGFALLLLFLAAVLVTLLARAVT